MVNLEERFMLRDMHRKGLSISEIARQTGRDRNTVRKVIQAGQSPAGDKPARRRGKQGQKLASFEGYLKQRIGEGVLNTRKLLRELKARGDQGGLSQLILYGQPYRTSREERAVMRYETEPGQQGQVDWSSFGCIRLEGRQHQLYALVMTLGLIPDISRNVSPEEGLLVAQWAIEGMSQGVVALGLGGPEVGNPPEKFVEAFACAHEAGLPGVPHAGETVGPESIRGALRHLQAVRIGHGVRCLEDPALVDELRRRQIPLEVSPTSNVCLGVAVEFGQHPLPQLIQEGLYVTLNSDDPALFNTTLTDEYLLAARCFGFDMATLEQLVMNGVNAALLPVEAKSRLQSRFRACFEALRALYQVNPTAIP